MTNTREEVAVAKAIAQTGSKEWYDEGDEYSQGFMELAKAAIAASNSKYVAGLVEALKAVAMYDPTPNYQSAKAQEALNNLPPELR